jgi:hypothetical protein
MKEKINKVKDLINQDIASGIIPEKVKTFSELHDYVDANMYLVEVQGDKLPSEMTENESNIDIDECNRIMDEINGWLAAGRSPNYAHD